ncbi:uncharacterized protein N7496_008251 [Penicillium cataractarum]|uniref:Uncharacterized protein n=1 Tax=Penicillium cataractarum TaxID=2100454 RepID=A0A9W9RY27_9EURO|nr:uncharacterized protein N7496_008251 [Penicillium cataractarum]KAJ5368491.1 hypothetical protein N7496_008251 [Penicillium cataractarum]
MNASNVSFNPSNMYSRDPGEKARITNLVISQAPIGAVNATVIYGDGRQLCTVDYYDTSDLHISREHIF